MARNCKSCKFYDVDYERDDELGDEIEVCEKGHRILLHLPFECPYFEKYALKPYVEQFTECDKCEYLSKCKSEGYVINCTIGMDDFEHYMRGINTYCRKENEPFENKKLSEIIEMANKSNDPRLKGSKELIQKAIKQFGDITYKEFIKEKIYKMYHP